MSEMTPTLPSSSGSLPPEGAVPPKGGLSAELAPPTLVASRASGGTLPLSREEGAVPPRGGLSAERLSTSGSGEVVLKAGGLTKRFTEGRLDVTVLRGVDLKVHRGETLAIVGASGSGKSTLLHLMGGLDAPSSGQVELKGQLLSALSPAQQGQLRNQHLGFVY